MPISKKTIWELHTSLTKKAATTRNNVLNVVESRSTQTFYDIAKGKRKLTELEKSAIAKIYDVDVDTIDWQDEKNFVA